METPLSSSLPDVQNPGPSWKSLLIGLVAIVVVGGVYAFAAKAFQFWPYGERQTTENGVITYQDPDFHYTVQYPSSWHSEKCQDQGNSNIVSFGDRSQLIICESDAPVAGYVTIQAGREISKEQLDQEVEGTLAGLNDPSRRNLTMDGEAAVRVDGTSRESEIGAPIGQRSVTIWVTHNGISYRLIFADTIGNLKLFEDVVKTFKFGDCAFQQVQCIRAPCYPQLMCPSVTLVPTPTSTPITTTNVIGQVLVGPTCPVVRPGDPTCDDRPYQGDFTVYLARSTTTNKEVIRFSTDKNGNFRISLQPGTYNVQSVSPIGIGKQTQLLVVKSTATTTVTLHFDTGIR